MSLMVVVLLAIYGWCLLVRLAKRREAFDSYNSIILLLEQFKIDAKQTWADENINSLDPWRELTLTTKLSNIEQRINLMQKYYNSEATRFSEEIFKLRHHCTIDNNHQQLLSDEPRCLAIHRIISDMVIGLTEDSFEYINQISIFSLPRCCKFSVD